MIVITIAHDNPEEIGRLLANAAAHFRHKRQLIEEYLTLTDGKGDMCGRVEVRP